ncbi:hypothetical protein E4U19_006864 [Claviceps sp. Clav32 group G5]|nr:hypothetical protein E4U19_006864 [Claviceps sp. Clav32 group G5]
MLGALTSDEHASDKELLLQVKGYSNASLADNLDTRRSTAGQVVMVAGGAVLWQSKRQTLVAHSSAKAEFINLTPTGLSII